MNNNIIYALGSGNFRRLNQSRSKVAPKAKFRARRKERLSRSKLKQAFVINPGAELFMYLIQCIRSGTFKVRCLNRAQVVCTVPVTVDYDSVAFALS